MATWKTPEGKIIDDGKSLDAMELSWGDVLRELARRESQNPAINVPSGGACARTQDKE